MTDAVLGMQINRHIDKIFETHWSLSSGYTIPTTSDLTALNTGKELSGAVVLYADIKGSTLMVDNYPPQFCAEIYKSFLYACGRIINYRNGNITAYDGDRIMAVFLGEEAQNNAVRASMEISGIVNKINNEYYVKTIYGFVLRVCIGIDESDLMVAKTGIRAENDLVWIGKAANHAAKLSDGIEDDNAYCRIRITRSIYIGINYDNTYNGDDDMWEVEDEDFMGDDIYNSVYYREL